MNTLNPEEAPTREERQLLRIYEDGSATCRNYSTLTMHVRTLAALVLAGGSGAVVLNMREFDTEEGRLLILIGALMVTLTVTLVLTNWHYQSAFEVVRNKLADMETNHMGQQGPWCAHRGMRDQQNDLLSSYGPFVVLAAAGTLAVSVGVHLLCPTDPAQAIKWGGLITAGFLVLGKVIRDNEVRARAAVQVAENAAKKAAKTE